jgi:hypothetical protein
MVEHNPRRFGDLHETTFIEKVLAVGRVHRETPNAPLTGTFESHCCIDTYELFAGAFFVCPDGLAIGFVRDCLFFERFANARAS